MKNLLLILALISISTNNLVHAAEDTHFKEEVLKEYVSNTKIVVNTS